MKEVRRNDARQRYELHIDGKLTGVADYSVRDDLVVLPHTEITRSMRGRGLGAELVRGALDDIRPTGKKVVPSCWYVAQFIDENPDYRDLLAS